MCIHWLVPVCALAGERTTTLVYLDDTNQPATWPGPPCPFYASKGLPATACRCPCRGRFWANSNGEASEREHARKGPRSFLGSDLPGLRRASWKVRPSWRSPSCKRGSKGKISDQVGMMGVRGAKRPTFPLWARSFPPQPCPLWFSHFPGSP